MVASETQGAQPLEPQRAQIIVPGANVSVPAHRIGLPDLPRLVASEKQQQNLVRVRPAMPIIHTGTTASRVPFPWSSQGGTGNVSPTLGPTQSAPRVHGSPLRNASKPIIPIRFPLVVTLIPRIPIGQPSVTGNHNALIGAYTPHQEAITSLGKIDPNRVLPGRARRSDKGPPKPGELTPYSADELKDIAKELGLSRSQLKKDLAEAILARLR